MCRLWRYGYGVCRALIFLISAHLCQVLGAKVEHVWKVSLKPPLQLLYEQNCLGSEEHALNFNSGQPFSNWSFSIKSPLLQFPIDPEEQNYVRKVYNVSFSRVQPKPFLSHPILVAVSAMALRNVLDLDPCDCIQSEGFLSLASGGHPLPPNALNLAHRYGGHQFGYWAGQLGDGRAALVGSYVNQQGQYWEAQLKGSGKTPYSRSGDGRAVLRSSVREFLASEAMHSLGVPTSRAASLTVSNERAWRDQFYDGRLREELTAMVLRLAPSWFRIGSLEILHYNKEYDLLKQTVDFVIEQYFPHLDSSGGNPPSRYAAFFAAMVNQTAELLAHWQAVGFTHGVCNTDNFSLLSLTIDYGPFGFMDQYDPNFVPNTSDDEGRYRYQYQPSVGHYNLQKLLEALRSLLMKDKTTWHEAQVALQLYPAAFNDAFLHQMAVKLGLAGTPDPRQLEAVVVGLLDMMETVQTDFTMTFRELSEVTMAQLVTGQLSEHLWALPRLLDCAAWSDWLSQYHTLSLSLAATAQEVLVTSYAEGLRQERMQRSNPRYILRNWMAEQAIRQAEEASDFSILHRLHRVLGRPFTEQAEAEAAGYARPPPPWAHTLRVSCSS